MEKYIVPLLLVFLPSLSLAKVPFYFYNQPSAIPQLFHHEPLHVSHAPNGAFHYTNFHNESGLYPSPEIRTECQVGSYCTVDSFCTVNVTISPVALNLTEEEKEERGELIPCWHVESQTIEVCCNIPTDEPQVEVKEEEIKDTRQCPRIPKSFSESSCSDVASTCGRVGYSDPACPNSELCCFDGCANRCISDLSPEPEPSSTASETISNFLSTSQSSSYHALPYRHYPGYYYPYHHPQNPHTSSAYHHSTSYTERPFHALFPQSPSYTISSGHTVVTTTPPPTTTTTTTTRAPRVYSQYPSAYEHFPSNSYSYQQSFGYGQPLSSRTKTHEALTQNTYQTSAQTYAPVEPQVDPGYKAYYGQTYTPYTAETPSYAEYETVPSEGLSSSNIGSVYHQSCPSALKCTPKKNCDFNGVIVSHVVSTSPEFDTVRVPLLPCTNAQTGETDVCCRDPNFVDPYSQY